MPDQHTPEDHAPDAHAGEQHPDAVAAGRDPAGANRDDAPESHNSEQDDEESQAQSVADEAYHPNALGLGDTVKVSSGDDFDDVQDLVDHMRQMDSSGVIDMGAFAGERNDDEEEGRYGAAADEE